MTSGFQKAVLALASLLGLVAVVAGALGAHPPEGFFQSEQSRGSWNTAVIFQMFHALAILALSGSGFSKELPVRIALVLFVGGTVLFSGSIYVLAIGGPGFLGPVTPLGGVGLIAGWACLFVGVLRADGVTDR